MYGAGGSGVPVLPAVTHGTDVFAVRGGSPPGPVQVTPYLWPYARVRVVGDPDAGGGAALLGVRAGPDPRIVDGLVPAATVAVTTARTAGTGRRDRGDTADRDGADMTKFHWEIPRVCTYAGPQQRKPARSVYVTGTRHPSALTPRL